jgi:hypothetical protein
MAEEPTATPQRGMTVAQAFGILQIQGEFGPAAFDGLDSDQQAALMRLQADCYLTIEEGAALESAAAEATGSTKAAPKRRTVLSRP